MKNEHSNIYFDYLRLHYLKMAPKKRVDEGEEEEEECLEDEVVIDKAKTVEEPKEDKKEDESKYPSLILNFDKKHYEDVSKSLYDLNDTDLLRVLIIRTEGKYKLNRALKDVLRASNLEINFPSFYQRRDFGDRGFGEHKFNDGEQRGRGGYRGGRGGYRGGRGGYGDNRGGYNDNRGGYGRKQREGPKPSFFDDDDDFQNVR